MMRAAVISAFNQPIEIKELSPPKPGFGEVLVHVKAAGLCTTDQHILEGRISTVKLPHIPGHEGAGEIVEVGEGVTGWSVGDRVVVSIYVTCNKCRFCFTGHENMCLNVTRIGFERSGFFSEYCAVPQQNLFRVPSNVSFEEACILPDAGACMLHAIRNKARVQAGDYVVVIGATGGLGMQAIQILKLLGARVIATSRDEERLRYAGEMGADYLINTKRENLVDTVKKITGIGADVVIDNVGLSQTVADSVHMLRRCGKVIIVGYLGSEFTADLFHLFMNEIEIIGCRASLRQDLADMLQWSGEGLMKPYISNKYPLEQINTALQDLAHGKIIGRSVLLP
ncbi:MAG: alcohol dehydrogenase catalytic domain-containing protein [Bacteroidota bacterium]